MHKNENNFKKGIHVHFLKIFLAKLQLTSLYICDWVHVLIHL